MKKILFFLVLILTLSFAAASFNASVSTITKNYGLNEQLKASIKISFDEQPLKSTFKDSEGNSISLEQLLNKTSYSYDCTPSDCQSTYVSSSPESTKSFTLNEGEEEVLGLYLTGVIDSIENIQFDIESNAAESISNQLKIDILNDGSFETGNSHIGTQAGQTEDGCFDSTEVISEARLTTSPYCQKIKLKEAPSYRFGAWVKKISENGEDIVMALFNKNGGIVKLKDGSEAACTLQKNIITPLGSIVQCQVDVLIPEEDEYYVCVLKTAGDGEYRIQSYSPTDLSWACGFLGIPVKQEVAAYNIVAQPLSFAPLSTITIENNLSSGETIASMTKDYIISEYGSLDCSSGCLIPIRLLSSKNQDITIKNIQVEYNTNAQLGLISTQMHTLTETGATITSESKTISLNEIFDLPSSEEESLDYVLKLNDEEILKETLSIKDIKVSLDVKETAVGFPTKLTLKENLSVSEYIWDFGDNKTSKTYSPETIHTYGEPGEYVVKVVLKTKDAEYTKEFRIEVQDSKRLIAINSLKLREQLDKIKSQIASFPQSAQDIVEQVIELNKTEADIIYLENGAKTAKTQEEYDELIRIILDTNLPESIFSSSTQKVPIFTQEYQIDFSPYEEISGEYVEESLIDETKIAAIFWSQENIQMRGSSEGIMMQDDGEVFPLTSVLEVTVSSRSDASYYYILIETPYGVNVTGPNLVELEGYKGVESTGEEVVLTISGSNIDLSQLNIFVMPLLEELTIQKDIKELPDAKNKKYVMLFLIFLALIFIGTMAYILLQKWYKVRYEKYLFKDRNNLYNAIVYVNSAKKQGQTNEQIKKSLRKSGWSGEQIRYIMRRYEGKQTGMYELPIQKIMSTTEKKEQQPSKPSNISSANPVKFSTNFQNRSGANRKFKI